MSCHICVSSHSRLLLLCPTCSRNCLYQLRLENTEILLEKEILGHQIEVIVASAHSQEQHPTGAAGPSEAIHESARRWSLQTIHSQQAGSSSRKDTLTQQIEVLKESIRTKKADISERRADLRRRHSDAGSALYQLEERETTTLTGIQNTTKRTEHLWHSLHSRTAEDRIFLCREAAYLYGLRQKTSRKDDARQTYVLGGTSIVDLRDMNGATPAQISTSLSNIARLLVLVSHYLSLRLPAQIILPHRNHPTPIIYAPSASYHSHGVADETVTPRSSGTSAAASKTADMRAQPRPRPLFIDKPLTRLAKEDSGTYALFLEGATLLTWDVAWLCRTQGINLASDSWEDACNVGKSLWQLLVAPPAQEYTLMRAFAGRDTQSKMKPAKDSPQTTIQRTKSFPMLGHYSHGTVHSFLAASGGTDFIRSWNLPTPTKIADKLKANLLGEMAGAEWELLEEKEWDEGYTETHQPPIPHEQRPFAPSSPQSKPNKERENHPTSAPGVDEARRSKGTSGWTKLNSR